MKKIHICTAEHPWSGERGTPVAHPDAVEINNQRDGWPGGDLVTYQCPHCKHIWEAELPQ